MKKIIAICLSVIACFTMSGCRNNTSGSEDFSSDSDSVSESTGDFSSSSNEGNNSETSSDDENSSSSGGESGETPPELEGFTETLNTRVKVSFGADGEFTVLAFSDWHLKLNQYDPYMENAINTLIDTTEPDLIILDGDNMSDPDVKTKEQLRSVLWTAVDYIEEKQIPWMHVFGNHDSENDLSREDQQDVYESFDYCISKDDAPEITGVGNYVIPVYSSDGKTIEFAVWGIDSNSYISAEDAAKPGNNQPGAEIPSNNYDFIHEDQIEWYVETSKKLEAYAGKKVPGMMAFHIELQESYYAWTNREALGLNYSDLKVEQVNSSAKNYGMFDAVVNRGDIKAIVNGHDHRNTFMVEYQGVKLCQAGTISTLTYNDKTNNAARVFTITEDNAANIETEVIYVEDLPQAVALRETGQGSSVLNKGVNSLMLFNEEFERVWNVASKNVNDKEFVYCRRINGADTLTFDLKGDWSSVDVVGKFKLRFNNHTYSYNATTDKWTDENGVVCNDIATTDENGAPVNFAEHAKYNSGYKWTTFTISNISTHWELLFTCSATPNNIVPLYVRNFIWLNSKYDG